MHCPYDDLHIYYLDGLPGPSFRPAGGSGFIGNWEEEGDSFLFFARPADEVVADLLRAKPHLRLRDRFQMTYEQWHGGPLEPVQVGHLRVVPPWHPEARAGGRDCIVLDPGVVFGTGGHPTTQDCLAAVQMAFERHPVDRVLDLGTGTGLLALAAARLGAGHVLAVDLNYLAARTAARNAQAGPDGSKILVVQGNALNYIDLSCDLMISNIHHAVMLQLVAHPGFMRRPGQFVLSGLLRGQAREIEALLRQKPVEILHKWEQDGIWHTFYGRHRHLSQPCRPARATAEQLSRIHQG